MNPGGPEGADESRDEVSAGAELLNAGGKLDPDLVRAASELDEDGALTIRFRLTRDLRKRLDLYLIDRIPYLSRNQIQRLIRESAVTVNARTPKPSTRLRLGDEITLVAPPPPSNEIPPEDIPLDILFEDEHLIVLNKHADIIVHPARGNKTGTIVNALSYHFLHNSSGSLSGVGEEDARPGVVHRLDRYTTGVMVAAKSDLAHWRLGKQFEARTVDKRYLAFVHGTVEPPLDTIEAPIGKHPRIRELMAVRHDSSAKPATTIYRLREQFDGFALVELELKTGRTHQIRVHLAHLGWPIVGDDLYGGRSLELREFDSNAPDPDSMVIDRQALHATMLAFRHPITGERVSFLAPAPADLRRLLACLREFRPGRGVITPPGAVVDLDAAVGTPVQ
ncbi:MAG: RluA family pseudouridine synthase [Phycisphaerales bacterium]